MSYLTETLQSQRPYEEDEDNENSPLLLSSSVKKAGFTNKKNFPAPRKFVHPQYAKKIKNEQMKNASFGSHEQINCNRDETCSNGMISSPPFACNGFFCVQCVRTKEVGILESFGKFYRVKDAGLTCIPWPCVRFAGRLSLRVQQLDVTFEGKTKDHVFVTIEIAILFKITTDNAKRAFYTLRDPEQQLEAFVYDVARSTITQLNIDDLFTTSKIETDVSLDLLRGLQGTFSQRYTGYDILNVLVLKISPNDHVRDAMNEINACKRWKEAMTHKAESDKYKRIKMAEADSQSSYLQGVGTAHERKAIAKGIQATLIDNKEDIMVEKSGHDIGIYQSKDVMDILLISQYYDTLCCISQGSSEKSMMLCYGIGGH